MPRIIDLTGRAFGRLRVVGISTTRKYGRIAWTCECSCGNSDIVTSSELKSGKKLSCGCLYKETRRTCGKTHGSTGTLTWRSWRQMLRRCNDPSSIRYSDYGKRGISVCREWMEFEVFVRDMGERPSAAHSIERLDNDGNYTPDNCRWATADEQANNRRTCRVLSIFGRTQTMSQWAHESGVHVGTLWNRLENGWDAERAVFQEVRRRA